MPVACGVADKFVSFIGVGAFIESVLSGVLTEERAYKWETISARRDAYVISLLFII